MGERRLCKAEVRGSSPLISTGCVEQIKIRLVDYGLISAMLIT